MSLWARVCAKLDEWMEPACHQRVDGRRFNVVYRFDAEYRSMTVRAYTAQDARWIVVREGMDEGRIVWIGDDQETDRVLKAPPHEASILLSHDPSRSPLHVRGSNLSPST